MVQSIKKINFNQQVVVKVYDDHLWMHNPGSLPPGMSVDDLKRSPHSVLRNPLVAKVFYLAGFVEQYGSGIQRMVKTCADAGIPEPVFSSGVTGFTLNIQRDILNKSYLTDIGLNERQISVMMYVKLHGSISSREYHESEQVSLRMAKYDLKELVQRGFLIRTGVNKTTRYHISPDYLDNDEHDKTGGEKD